MICSECLQNIFSTQIIADTKENEAHFLGRGAQHVEEGYRNVYHKTGIEFLEDEVAGHWASRILERQHHWMDDRVLDPFSQSECNLYLVSCVSRKKHT